MSNDEIQLRTQRELARGQWPTWPFTRLTPEQLRALEQRRIQQSKQAVQDLGPALF
jgi:hypothetical protein